MPDPYLIAIGDSPIARALVPLGTSLGFDVAHLVDAGEGLAGRFAGGHLKFAVVATMGVDDETALLAALELEPDYLALVGSRRRFATLADYLRAQGVDDERIAAIQAPAGLDISVETPAEIALSIMAEIIQVRAELSRQVELGVAAFDERAEPPRIVIDPIYGMQVDLATSRHTLEVDGKTLGFCCAGCLEQYRHGLAV